MIKNCKHDALIGTGICLTCPAPADWQHHASCIGHENLDLWFPDPDQEAWYLQAAKICASCPVAGFCLEDGIGEKYGMWAGTLPADRHALRKTLPTDREAKRARLRLIAHDVK